MKKIIIIVSCLILPLAMSCSQIQKSISSLTNKKNVDNYSIAVDHPTNIKNAADDKHAAEETAIVISAANSDSIYFGKDQYPLEVMGEKVDRLLEKNPAERQLIYLNSSLNVNYDYLAKILDVLRKRNIENFGFLVDSATKTKEPFQILKVKCQPEPKESDPPEMNNYSLIDVQKDGKIFFGKYESPTFKPEKPELKIEDVGNRLKQFFKENEEKKIFRKGTNEVDKTIHIRAARSERFNTVAKLVDEAIGAGATVYLQIDDLNN